MMRILLAGLVTCGLATAASAQYFGEGDFTGIGSMFEYDPSSACMKPMRPFSDDRYAWEAYRSEASLYLDCLKRAANNDLAYVQNQVQEGYDKAVRDFLSEVENGF